MNAPRADVSTPPPPKDTPVLSLSRKIMTLRLKILKNFATRLIDKTTRVAQELGKRFVVAALRRLARRMEGGDFPWTWPALIVAVKDAVKDAVQESLS